MPPASTKAKGFHVPSQNDGSPALPCPHSHIGSVEAARPQEVLKMPSISRGRHEAAQRAHTDDGGASQFGCSSNNIPRAQHVPSAHLQHGLQCPAGQHACGTTSVSYSASHKQAAEDGWKGEKEKRKQPFAWGRENAGRLGRIIYIFTGMGNGDESCWMDGFV
ncbi:hypothetical protein Pmani_034896 [Petrolisthes manimaculis]|uniref:Uncharacterized protein n=1 Tax=Petrolisthes manimaculis TaxID=1843537 RepID=A0AAE1TP76_9EUCA|nr:hypothetical protein Pmani_034896 [Petrolisthes manimaculis]